MANGKFHGVMSPTTPAARVMSTCTQDARGDRLAVAAQDFTDEELEMWPARAASPMASGKVAFFAGEQREFFAARKDLAADRSNVGATLRRGLANEEKHRRHIDGQLGLVAVGAYSATASRVSDGFSLIP
jgi:hypothetical protein